MVGDCRASFGRENNFSYPTGRNQTWLLHSHGEFSGASLQHGLRFAGNTVKIKLPFRALLLRGNMAQKIIYIKSAIVRIVEMNLSL